MKYTVKQLRDSFYYVENYLKKQNIDEIELTADWYWNIKTTEKFNFSNVPATDNDMITVGSLLDDIETLDNFIVDEVDIPCNLSRLASILEYLNYYIIEENES